VVKLSRKTFQQLSLAFHAVADTTRRHGSGRPERHFRWDGT